MKPKSIPRCPNHKSVKTRWIEVRSDIWLPDYCSECHKYILSTI